MKIAPAILTMIKPRIVTLVLATTALGFYLASWTLKVPFNSGLLIATLIGTAITAAGAAVLNHYLERDVDGLMSRTSNRALVVGAVSPGFALALGVALNLVGVGFLVWKVNLLVSFLSLLTSFLYVLVYTPLKRTTWLNTTIGAIPGALPPMGGWAAATGNLEAGAWIIFAIMFLWQHPHFYAIAWMYKEDYAKGGLRMLSVVEPDGRRLFNYILYFSAVLVPVSLIPAFTGHLGALYLVGAMLLGTWMFAVGCILHTSKSKADARGMLRASIIYLPLLSLLSIADTLI
jgi:protoheme IX farnesyltransferase